jgi:uncharacterized membrane protein YraQ (UPF0718 family)
MISEITRIFEFMLNAFVKIWPFILITIPISVFVNVSGVGNHIKTILNKQPVISIIFATFFGALSPLCSCTVIPVISSLLIAGVPLAPVMSFWVASPSMDPEIFFLSAGQLGWDLAIWRLGATFLLSLVSGFVTLILQNKGFFADGILRKPKQMVNGDKPRSTRPGVASLSARGSEEFNGKSIERITNVSEKACCGSTKTVAVSPIKCEASTSTIQTESPESCSCTSSSKIKNDIPVTACCSAGEDSKESDSSCGCSSGREKTAIRNSEDLGLTLNIIRKEILRSVWFVARFMALAFFLEALIIFYVPETVIKNILGSSGPVSILTSTVIGVPLYTSTLSALGILKGLLAKGMLSSAALAFLISGPVTTIPAMSAVYGIASRRVFLVYLATAFFGALFFGGLHFLFINIA